MRNFQDFEKIQYEDCPNCKANNAFMGSTKWGHGIMCCSDECGIEIAKKIRVNTSSKKYRKAEKELERAKDKVRSIKYKGTGVDYDPYMSIVGDI